MKEIKSRILELRRLIIEHNHNYYNLDKNLISDFDYDKFPNKSKNEVFKLAGKRLGCFCKPELCHGDVLADYLNSWDDGE